MTKPLLFTGAAGALGSYLRAHLAKNFGPLRSSDIVPFGPAHPNEEIVLADLADKDAVERIVEGCRAVVHFGGISTEDSFERLFESSFRGTYHVFDAARRHGLERIVFASSNHAIGFHRTDTRLDANSELRPDTIYGLSKAFGENLGRMMVDKFGLKVACLRIGSAIAKPSDPRHLATWLSLEDLYRLVAACLTSPALTYAVLYGASANDRSWWDNSLMDAIGYRPRDNSERFVQQIIPQGDTRDPNDPAVKFQGGVFCSYAYMDREFVAHDRALLDGVMASLLARTRASRTTVRLDLAVRHMNVQRPAGEACAPGVNSLRDESSLDQRALETVKWIERERRTLVQHDFSSDPKPPKALIEIYGVTAQVLAPIIVDQAMVGWVSAHQTGAARRWRDEDIAEAEQAAAECRRIMWGR
jgi:uronate dehydrogenase